MDLRIVLAMLGGMVIGMAALIIAIAAGLDLKRNVISLRNSGAA